MQYVQEMSSDILLIGGDLNRVLDLDSVKSFYAGLIILHIQLGQ